ncbi:DUF1294 domain-containing protein [Cytobacillus spongiae]|uniref:DUF1294 domain-containing protein n=1 Tax=Cytobacillus spongiae TaxID=2901381 RepID=UPI001F2FAF46|nr:DUF1294 domain-containing protein [Cytobacillus spongiae]UII55130.1 DUF1294 domain-containing protein [Cytobacillus spongiae]
MFGLWIGIILLVNVAAFSVMRMDKRKAKKKEYRISERTLWLLALLGGATGMYLAMHIFRHKTKHFSFQMGLPTLSVIELLFFYLLINHLT